MKANVVIVGSGIVAMSCAYWLGKFGVEDVLVLSRKKVSLSGKHLSIFNQQFSSSVLTEMAMKSRQLIKYIPCDFKANGSMFSSEQAIEVRHGLMIESLSPEKAKDIVPQAQLVSDVSYLAADGYFSAKKLFDHYDGGAREFGTRFLEAEARHIYVKDGVIEHVMTSAGKVVSNHVIIAADSFSGVVGRMASIDIPVIPLRHHMVETLPFDKVSHRTPCFFDMRNRFVLRPEDGSFIIYGRDLHETVGFNAETDHRIVLDLMERVEKVFPVFADAKVREAWSFHVDITPDGKPIIGKTPLRGLYCVAGFNGFREMMAPVAGRIVAELFTYGKTEMDISSLSLSRFRSGHPEKELNIL